MVATASKSVQEKTDDWFIASSLANIGVLFSVAQLRWLSIEGHFDGRISVPEFG